MSSQSQSIQRQAEDRSFTRDARGVIHPPLDPEIEDLIHSWRRITEPGLRKIALGVIRAMAS